MHVKVWHPLIISGSSGFHGRLGRARCDDLMKPIGVHWDMSRYGSALQRAANTHHISKTSIWSLIGIVMVVNLHRLKDL